MLNAETIFNFPGSYYYEMAVVRDDDRVLGHVGRAYTGRWVVLDETAGTKDAAKRYGEHSSREDAVRALPYDLGMARTCPTCEARPGDRCVVTDLDTGRTGSVRINGHHSERYPT